MGVIYVRPNLINGKKYVGQATNLEVRQKTWKNLNKPYAGNVINNARKKYGIESFGFEILKECEDEELDYWEKYYIKELNTKVPYGYNMTDGGDGCQGYIHSEETKQKIGEGNKGKKLSEETRKKISEARKGKTTWIKGKHHSEETKQKISKGNKGNKGKKFSVETRKKMSEARKGKTTWIKGKHHSEETRKKISEGMKGKKISEETRKKISETNSKPVLQIDQLTDTIIAEYPSLMEVQRQLGISHSNISNCCNGKRKTCCGFKWRYK